VVTTTPNKPSIQNLYEPVRSQLKGVKDSLAQILPPESQLLAQTVKHALFSGGKFLRPVVTLLMGGATGRSDTALIEVAAVSEMIHIATLLHDDVLDEADLRRGKKTVRQQWGNHVSVLSGDYLLAQASLKLATVGHIRLVAIYSRVLADLCDGEVEQIRNSYHLDLSSKESVEAMWQGYYHKTLCKTASLFSAGCESAAVLNGLAEEEVEQLKAYGRDFGIAFQIVDDLLDYTSSEEEMGKPVMDDLRNGILNAPILLALESPTLDTTEKDSLVSAIQSMFDASEVSDNQETVVVIKQALEKTQAIERTQALADEYICQALKSIDFLPGTVEKQALIGLCQFVTQRRY